MRTRGASCRGHRRWRRFATKSGTTTISATRFRAPRRARASTSARSYRACRSSCARKGGHAGPPLRTTVLRLRVNDLPLVLALRRRRHGLDRHFLPVGAEAARFLRRDGHPLNVARRLDDELAALPLCDRLDL